MLRRSIDGRAIKFDTAIFLWLSGQSGTKKNKGDRSIVDEKHLDISQVLELIPVGKTAFYRMISEGKAPRPYKWNHRISRWKKTEIDQFIKNTWKRAD
jgi:predicted DNA-binding transcriptional regulator AlpA